MIERKFPHSYTFAQNSELMAQILFILIIAFVVIEFLLARFLDFLNEKKRSPDLPKEAEGIYDEEKYRKSQDYEKANHKVSVIGSWLNIVLILAVLLLGGFAWLDQFVRGFTEHPVLMALFFFGILSFASGIVGLPFGVYSTFVIEEKFGFNKMTPKLYVLDKIKNILLSAILGGGILSLVIFIYQWTGEWFWLIAWATVAAITIFFTMFYTSFIVPIFNKLTPLEDGDLRKSIERYAEKVGFSLKNIFVIDGSKRSSKANAYFSGFGAKKSIVLYDTLIKDHTTEEITAVLAHEVGHYQKKHIIKSMAISVLQMGVLFFVFGWLVDNPLLANVLSAEENSFHLALVTFALLYSPISLVIGLLMNAYSRKNEFEADAYAKETYAASPLKDALKGLAVNHLSNLTPHPAYVFFYYSHPPLLQRLGALER